MKRIVLLFAVVLLGWSPDVATAQPSGTRQRSAFGNGWLSNYDDAKAAARRTGKPLLVVLRCVP